MRPADTVYTLASTLRPAWNKNKISDCRFFKAKSLKWCDVSWRISGPKTVEFNVGLEGTGRQKKETVC